MRGVLIDTQILLWVRIVPEKLTPAERRVLDSAFFRYVSAATLWEMAILMDLGRIARDERLFELPENFDFPAFPRIAAGGPIAANRGKRSLCRAARCVNEWKTIRRPLCGAHTRQSPHRGSAAVGARNAPARSACGRTDRDGAGEG